MAPEVADRVNFSEIYFYCAEGFFSKIIILEDKF